MPRPLRSGVVDGVTTDISDGLKDTLICPGKLLNREKISVGSGNGTVLQWVLGVGKEVV